MFALFDQFIENIRHTLTYYKTIEELNNLTDMELKDLGLSRCDIIPVANQTYIRKYTQ